MRTLIVIAVLIFLTQTSYGQIVPSSCVAPDSIVAKFTDDADRLALRRIYRNNLTYKDSAVIPQLYSDTVLNALIAVYNATSLPARDTVTTLYNIYAFHDLAISLFHITADSSLTWMHELENGNLITGNPTIDNLIVTYGLSISDYHAFYGSPTDIVRFKTNDNYNIPIVIKDLDTITGVKYAQPQGWGGDGPNIWDSIYTDHVELVYSFGWGDCFSGCMERRYWKFNVYFDCSVEFVESYGSSLPITGIDNIIKPSVSVTPNPFRNYLDIKGQQSNYEYSIYNILGQKMIQGQTSENRIKNLDDLQAGMYLLFIKTDSQLTKYKLIKQ